MAAHLACSSLIACAASSTFKDTLSQRFTLSVLCLSCLHTFTTHRAPPTADARSRVGLSAPQRGRRSICCVSFCGAPLSGTLVLARRPLFRLASTGPLNDQFHPTRPLRLARRREEAPTRAALHRRRRRRLRQHLVRAALSARSSLSPRSCPLRDWLTLGIETSARSTRTTSPSSRSRRARPSTTASGARSSVRTQPAPSAGSRVRRRAA